MPPGDREGGDKGSDPQARRPAFAVVRTRPGPAEMRGVAWGFGSFGTSETICESSIGRCFLMPVVTQFALAAAALAQPSIVVTASRTPLAAAEAPVSLTTFEADRLQALGLPAAADVLRLSPGVAVATSGPRGSQTQLRIRGAEANHTLLFVDGIRFNDPAAGNEPRFELLAVDPFTRLEIVRGPQSALWGSEAIGGVIAAQSADPFTGSSLYALGEYGSLNSLRLAGRGSVRSGAVGLTASGTFQRSDGIDSFGRGGERDGFDQTSMSLRGEYRPTAGFTFGLVGHWVEGRSDFDGYDPLTFRRADTRDATDNRIGAVRGWATAQSEGWTLELEGSLLDSDNRNRLGDERLNTTSGRRFTAGGQLSRVFAGHRLTAAIEHEAEDFQARDTVYFGGTDQDRSRTLTAFAGEWRGQWSPWLATGLAVRHDAFSAFDDATTVRASVLIQPAPHWTLHAAYGEGIAQPTFYDLFGFFPGSFRGNPSLRPERSRSWEAGLRWEDARLRLALTGFASRLQDEIVGTFDSATFLSGTANADGRSTRRGIELEGEAQLAPWATLAANYTYLDAQGQESAGNLPTREARRPRHSANVIAGGRADRFSWGASLAYVGNRQDTDFDVVPAREVRLGDYLLASLRVGYEVLQGVELYGRVENGLNADYQDAVGYATAGRTVHAGLRMLLGR